MARFKIITPSRNYVHIKKTWTAGQLAEKGNYVCRHCNSEISLGHNGCLPLCHTCYGRRYSLI